MSSVTSLCPAYNKFSWYIHWVLFAMSWVTTLEFFTLGVSVRLSDRSEVTQNKINYVKNCPQ